MSNHTKQSFSMAKINRSEITEAYYNSRKISEKNRQRLKAEIKKHGLVMPLIINKRTNNTLVAGHMRLSILDELSKTKDYELDVAVIDVEEAEEVKLNVLLNNQSVMGEWDLDMLAEFKNTFEDIDFVKDLGFDQSDLKMFNFDQNDMNFSFPELEKPKVTIDNEKANDIKNKSRQDYKDRINNQAGIAAEPFRNDFILTITFPSNNTKQDFMRAINQKENVKFIEWDKFIEFIRDDYRI